VIDELRDVRLRAQTLDEEIKVRVEERASLERSFSYAAIRAGEDRVLTDQRKRRAQLEARIEFLSDRYEQEASKREEDLRKHLEKLKHVWVVPSSAMTDARLLAARVDERVRETGMLPLSKSERK